MTLHPATYFEVWSDHLRWNPWHEIGPDWNASVAGLVKIIRWTLSLASVVSTCNVGFPMVSCVKVSAVHQAIRTRSSHFADRQLIGSDIWGRVETWNQNLSPFALLQERKHVRRSAHCHPCRGCLQAYRFHSLSKSSLAERALAYNKYERLYRFKGNLKFNSSKFFTLASTQHNDSYGHPLAVSCCSASRSLSFRSPALPAAHQMFSFSPLWEFLTTNPVQRDPVCALARRTQYAHSKIVVTVGRFGWHEGIRCECWNSALSCQGVEQRSTVAVRFWGSSSSLRNIMFGNMNFSLLWEAVWKSCSPQTVVDCHALTNLVNFWWPTQC